MSEKLKQHLYCLLCYVMAIVVSNLVCNYLLNTILNAVFGADVGLPLSRVICFLMIPAIAFSLIYKNKSDDHDEMRRYIASMEGQTYDLKRDLASLMRQIDVWAEIIFLSLATVVYWLFNVFTPVVLFNVPLVLIFEFWAAAHLHRTWMARDRARDKARD